MRVKLSVLMNLPSFLLHNSIRAFRFKGVLDTNVSMLPGVFGLQIHLSGILLQIVRRDMLKKRAYFYLRGISFSRSGETLPRRDSSGRERSGA